MSDNLLTARGAREFLQQYWQKKPLLARHVLSEDAAAIDRAQLIALACRDEVESRLVIGTGRKWRVEHGPFRRRDFAQLPPRNWTLLVNGVENHIPAARALQMRFDFVPFAFHDDVMVSYAAPGGGVGPHFDSYDVFLVQGAGSRRWEIGHQRDLTLIADAPLKLLRHFRPQREWTLQSGDLLYLPPRWAHHGTAVGECITWSVGLRAPNRREIVLRFLDYLHDHLQSENGNRNAGLRPQRRPAAIGAELLRQVYAMVNSIGWTNADIQRCLGEYLTEPRPQLVFGRARRISAARFARAIAIRGVRLALKSRMLADRNMVFMNGESAAMDAAARRSLGVLADRRRLPPRSAQGKAALELLYRWHCAGYIELDNPWPEDREPENEERIHIFRSSPRG